MADSFVQVSPDSSGKQIDAQAIQNAAGQTVYRQNIVLGDPADITEIASVDDGHLSVLGTMDRVRAHYQAVQARIDAQGFGGAGFVPVETPDFLVGV
jgi:hypothetical protein